MSSGKAKATLRGVIVQNGVPVGSIQVSGPFDPFIESFHREYASLGLRVFVPSDKILPPAASPWAAFRPLAASAAT